MIHKDVSYSPTDRLRAPPMISSTAPHSPKPANSTSIVEESDIGEVPSEEQPELDPIEPMTELEHYTSTSASRASPLPLPRKKREASSAGKPWKALSKLSAKATRDFSQLVGGKDPSIGRNERAESPQFSIAMPPPPDSRLTSPAPEQSSQISLAQWATMGNRRHSPSDLGDSHSVDQVDELLPSSSPPDSVAQLSPRHRRATLVNTSQSQPLFLDATQSDPLPVVLESQAEPAGKAVTQKLRKVSVNSSTNSSEEAREVELSVSVARKSLSQPTTGSSPGLGVFAGLQALKRRAFAMPQLMVSTQGNAPKKDAYGRIGKESESEEEDSEESPAEDASQSHIPTARTAGKVGRV
ncbi:hypothetical protein DL96DRAFT_1153620 [Flagelloscypha sp. PMI_526]|nr:hypothetical protein DL96DRAFT_1153620 [Flagelloscypha sp. PMI_526]